MSTSLSRIERRTWHGAVLTVLLLIFLLWFSTSLRESPSVVNQAVHVKGAMVLSVFGGADPEPLDATGFRVEYRTHLEAYSARRAAFRSRLPEPAPDTPAHETWS